LQLLEYCGRRLESLHLAQSHTEVFQCAALGVPVAGLTEDGDSVLVHDLTSATIWP
jgi:hypothetical protein